MLELTGGRPYETQELCSFIWARARAEGRESTETLVERALEEVPAETRERTTECFIDPQVIRAVA